MITIHPMPRQIEARILQKLARVETATVGHFRDVGFVDRGIQSVLPGKRIAGTAVTVALPHADSALLHHVLGLVRPGDILVIDRLGDTRHACWGGVVTAAAKIRGIAGGVIDGPGTDFTEIRNSDMPLWCRGPSPVTTRLLGLGGTLNGPVNCGGVVVRPGDAVLADESGVLILSPEEAEAVADTAIGKQEAEPALVARLRAGELIGDITGASAKVMAALKA